MTELSKIVRQRLRVKTATMADHPDADLLTAFTERSLTERERTGVMQHLAHCGDCREVVALALPAEIEEAVVARGGVRGNWFRLPVLRWAAVAVCIAAAVSVGTLEYRNHSTRSLTASALALQENSKLEKQDTVATLAEAPQSFEARAERKAEGNAKTTAPGAEKGGNLAARQSVGGTAVAAPNPRLMAPSRAFAGSIGSRRFGSGSGAGMAGAASSPNGLATADAATPSPPSPAVSAQSAAPAPFRPPAVSESVEVSATTGVVETEQAELSTEKEVVGKAKPSMNQQVVSGSSPAPSSSARPRNTLAAPRWTIAVNGTLQRSLDGGTTWQELTVTGDGSMSANFMPRSKAAESADLAKTNDAKKQSSAAATLVFRAVAANGAEVWAGGSGGALYHTVDAGNSWARVLPSYEGVVLGGDIIRIEFPDLQHVQISTSTGETWTTSDGAQTWLKMR